MKILILAYHRVYPGYHIDPETFEYQTQTLKERFTPLTLDEAIRFTRGELKLEKDGVVITFDDGWADNFVYAYPILKKYGLRGTIFASTGLISDEHRVRPTLEDYWNNKVSCENLFRGSDSGEAAAKISRGEHTEEFLTWDEINLMKPVIQVESHAHSHAYHFRSSKIIGSCKTTLEERQNWLLLSGTSLKPDAPIYESGSALKYPRYDESENRFENHGDYEKRVRNELETSIQKILENTGYRSKYLAWPYGEYNPTATQIAKTIGFQACLTTIQGYVSAHSNRYKIRRFSPPRNRYWFAVAVKGRIGIMFYRSCVAAVTFMKNILGHK